MNYKEVFGEEWYKELGDFIESPGFLKIGQQIAALRRQGKVIIPDKGSDLLFKVFRTVPFNKVKVIILGQDVYSNPPEAYDGLAFSNSEHLLRPQPSLRNILEEIEEDIYNGLNIHRATDISLYPLAEQGVFLINTALTVERNKPESHLAIWKPFTEQVIQALQKRNDLIWMLWGSKAQSYSNLITNSSHYIIKTGHPSSLNTTNPFKGCRCFSECNRELEARNLTSIIW